MREELIRLDWISKSFGSSEVLRYVNFSLYAGEIHAVMGANAEGKSTLLHIITGEIPPDDGQYYLEEKMVAFSSPYQAKGRGIFSIKNDSPIVPQLSCTDNAAILLKRPPGKLIYNKKSIRTHIRYLIHSFKLDDLLTPELPGFAMSTLSRMALHILCAIQNGATALVLDEPFSALDALEAYRLKDIMRHVVSRGVAIVYTTHSAANVYDLADRITILRKGCCTAPITNPRDFNALNEMVLRHTVTGEAKRCALLQHENRNVILFRAEDCKIPGFSENLNFQIAQGEILGLVNMGPYRISVCDYLFGMQSGLQGTFYMEQQPCSLTSPAKAIAAGMGYLRAGGENRDVFTELSAEENLLLPFMRKLFPGGVVSSRVQHHVAKDYSDFLLLDEKRLTKSAKHLSFGMQKRLEITRWFCIPRRLILLNEPTKGLDTMGKHQLEQMILSRSETGTSFIIESSNLDDIITLCNRALVIYNGRVLGNLEGPEITPANVFNLIFSDSQPEGISYV